MTKKRFTVIDREEPRKQSVAEKGIPCTARHCCTRLNRLTEENEQLKIKLENVEDARKSYKEDWKACTAYCDEYKNEIHNLKDNINGLLEENEQLKSYTGEMEDYLARLEEKNEQLKKEVEDLKQALIRCAFDDK